MVEINNQRKAFLDMLAWSGELITDVRKPNRYDVIGNYLLITQSPSQACHAKPKTQINRRRTLPASFPLVGCLPQATAWDELLSKSRCAVALQQIKERGAYLWLIVVISSGNQAVVPISGLHCRALVMVSSSIRRATDCKIQRNAWAGDGQRDWCMSRVTAIISPLWISASSSACHGLLIITVITPLPTKPGATKMPKFEAGERGNYWHADASAWCCCARCKIHEELADAKKAENDALRDDVAAGRRRLHIKAVISQCVKPPPPPAWIMQPPRLAPRRRDYFTLRERLITMQKQLEGLRSILSEAADRVAHIDGQLMYVSNTRASSGYKLPKVIKPSNPFTNVCWVSV